MKFYEPGLDRFGRVIPTESFKQSIRRAFEATGQRFSPPTWWRNQTRASANDAEPAELGPGRARFLPRRSPAEISLDELYAQRHGKPFVRPSEKKRQLAPNADQSTRARDAGQGSAASDLEQLSQAAYESSGGMCHTWGGDR